MVGSTIDGFWPCDPYLSSCHVTDSECNLGLNQMCKYLAGVISAFLIRDNPFLHLFFPPAYVQSSCPDLKIGSGKCCNSCGWKFMLEKFLPYDWVQTIQKRWSICAKNKTKKSVGKHFLTTLYQKRVFICLNLIRPEWFHNSIDGKCVSSQLVIRVHLSDESSKTMMVDERQTVRQVQLLLKSLLWAWHNQFE